MTIHIYDKLEDLKVFLKAVASKLDPEQPVCSNGDGKDYYVQDALEDLEQIDAAYCHLNETNH